MKLLIFILILFAIIGLIGTADAKLIKIGTAVINNAGENQGGGMGDPAGSGMPMGTGSPGMAGSA